MKTIAPIVAVTFYLSALYYWLNNHAVAGLCFVLGMTFTIISIPVFLATPENMFQNNKKD